MTASFPPIRSFRLAPMDGLNLALTLVVGLLVIPVPLVVILSHVDYAEVVHLRSGRPWRITPESPQEFVRVVRELLQQYA